MKKTIGTFIILIFLSVTGIVFADKGQVWPYPVSLAEDSQKAIILHNNKEEVLILGTQLKAGQETRVLEFIPFPSEPTVSSIKGNPFQAIQELIAQKQLQFIENSKGQGSTSPVEIKFEAQLGLHDVTVIKINDLEGFSKWVAGFFKKKGITVKNNLSGVYQNAADYLNRGFNYFVFDYVFLKKEAKSPEPLLYKFESGKLYYPLKTSNVIGGKGLVDLVLILPGSLGLLKDGSDFQKLRELFNGGNWDLSSSSKAYPDEIKVIYPEADALFKTCKIYMQVLQFYGNYEFKDDLILDISNIAPYAYKHMIYRSDYGNYLLGGSYELAESFSSDEKTDMAEAYSRRRPEWVFTPEMMDIIQDSLNSGNGDNK